MADVNEIANMIARLSEADRLRLFKKLTAWTEPALTSVEPARNMKNQRAESCFALGSFCPYCKGRHIVRNGKQSDGSQRFLCRDCGRRFQAASAAQLSNTVTPEKMNQLMQYVHCMSFELSLRQTSAECKISTVTALCWRRKIFDALAGTLKAVAFQGIVEADETFFQLSFKGNRRFGTDVKVGEIPLIKHKRGGVKSGIRGIGTNKVCVPIAVIREGGFTGKVCNLGGQDHKDLSNILKRHIDTDEVLVTDGARLYVHIAKYENVPLVQIKGNKGKHGILNILRIKSFHSDLKGVVNSHFKGVATKYLNNYVTWYGFLHAQRANLRELEDMLFKIALDAVTPAKNRNLADRTAVPVLSERQKEVMGWLL